MHVSVSGQSTDNSTSAVGHVGIAAVGLGSIAEVFMHAVTASSNARITGLVTGHPAEKGVKFGALYNVPRNSIYTYETFDRLKKTIRPSMRFTSRCPTACIASSRYGRLRQVSMCCAKNRWPSRQQSAVA